MLPCISFCFLEAQLLSFCMNVTQIINFPSPCFLNLKPSRLARNFASLHELGLLVQKKYCKQPENYYLTFTQRFSHILKQTLKPSKITSNAFYYPKAEANSLSLSFFTVRPTKQSQHMFLAVFYDLLFVSLLRQRSPACLNRQNRKLKPLDSSTTKPKDPFPAWSKLLFPDSPRDSNFAICITQFIIQLSTMKGGVAHHAKNMKAFAILLVALEVIIITLYGVFVRIERPSEISNDLNSNRYPAFQDVSVMMLIGFGFLMAFSKTFSWSAISYTFFMNAILIQLYILLSAFWKRVLHYGFNADNYYIYLTEIDFTLALYSAASMFISFGCVVGRVGPLECLIMCVFHEIGFTLNQAIFEKKIHAFDVGGSMVIHAFGAYSGLAFSLILSSLSKPNTRPTSNYFSNVFAFIGTLFLWMFWPSFNFGAFALTAYTKTQIIINTILSLTGSCLSTFAMSAFLKEKFTMEYLLNATLAGGVIIGAAAGIITSLGGSMAIGFLGGIVSTLGYRYLSPYLQEKFGLYDTCGVHNLHGIQGLLGGIISAIVAASYYYPSAIDAYSMNSTDFPEYATLVSQPFKQGGRQIAATFISIGIGIATSLVCGIFLRIVYSFDQKEFFTDAVYFDEAEEFIQQLHYHHGKLPQAKPAQPALHQPYESPALDTSDKMMSEEVNRQL